MRVMAATVNRTSRGGQVMGKNERITREEALKAITLWEAYQHFEEDRKGSIEVGKLADLVILSDNPLTVESSTIGDIVVLQTIKGGPLGLPRASGPGAHAGGGRLTGRQSVTCRPWFTSLP